MKSPAFRPLKTVLLVDEKEATRATVKWFLGSFGFTVDAVCTAEEALVRFDHKLHDAVITENAMSGMSGSEMAHIIKLRSNTTPVIMFTDVPPTDHSCIDCLIQRPAHLLTLKEGLDRLLTARIN